MKRLAAQSLSWNPDVIGGSINPQTLNNLCPKESHKNDF